MTLKRDVKNLIRKYFIPDLTNIIMKILIKKDWILSSNSEILFEIDPLVRFDSYYKEMVESYRIQSYSFIETENMYPRLLIQVCKYRDRSNYFTTEVFENINGNWELVEEATYDIHRQDSYDRFKQLNNILEETGKIPV